MTHGPVRHRFAHARVAVLAVLLAHGAMLVLTGSPAAAAPATMPDASHATAHTGSLDTTAQHAAMGHTVDAAAADTAPTASSEPLTCAKCGAEQHEAMAACSLMLFAVALLALPFVSPPRWLLSLRRALSRRVGRMTWTPRTPDLTALCVLRT